MAPEDQSVAPSAAPSANPYRRSLLRQQRSRDTRGALLRAAAKLWADNAFESTTVAQICGAAGMGRTTFYLHFESKEHLLAQLAWATAGGVAADVEAAHGRLDSQLEAFVDGLARRMEAVPRALTALVIRSAMFGPGGLPPHDVDHISFDEILTDILQEGQDHGEISGVADARELGAVLAGMTMDAILRWATGSSDPRPLGDSLRLRVGLIVDPLRTGA